MSEPLAEHQVLLDLVERGGEMGEVALSLAAGSVLRGRLSPQEAALLSGYTARELQALAGHKSTAFDPTVLVSVVIPAFNEEENLDSLWRRLAPVLDSVGSGEVTFLEQRFTDA